MSSGTRNEYFAKYMIKRYHQRRDELVKRLGGKCLWCETKENLQLDHKDKNKKNVEPARLMSLSKIRFEAEIPLLQLLCAKHHGEKTAEENGKKRARGTHGTLSSYRYCKCGECRAANAKSSREYRKGL